MVFICNVDIFGVASFSFSFLIIAVFFCFVQDLYGGAIVSIGLVWVRA